MDTLSLESKLDRIIHCERDSVGNEIQATLLHAFMACLSTAELCSAAEMLLDSNTKVYSAIRTRLRRIARKDENMIQLDDLATRLLTTWASSPSHRRRIDSMLSLLYEHFSAPTRKDVLDFWLGRGSSDARARWLKAFSRDETLLDYNLIYEYWSETQDWRAAKVIAYEGDVALVLRMLKQIGRADDKGWIISRAIIRLEGRCEFDWSSFKLNHPGSYAYVCSQIGRHIAEEEAYEIVQRCKLGFDGDLGLALWSFGQMGFWSVLEQVSELSSEMVRIHYDSIRHQLEL